ncbi:hypothetical protein [Hydrogenobacter thermophilus]|uniref:hypothetical protein n=1 Tax=Hydrogenobacter thermophilus TaxID=940 RepID=UPI0030F911C7
MAKIRIPWQGDSPLLTPYGVYEFKDGVSVSDVDERVIRRLKAIYGDKVEVIDESGDTDKGTAEEVIESTTENPKSNKKRGT